MAVQTLKQSGFFQGSLVRPNPASIGSQIAQAVANKPVTAQPGLGQVMAQSPILQRTDTTTVTPTKTATTSTKKTKTPSLSKAEQDYQKQVEKTLGQTYGEQAQFLAGQEARLREMQPQYEQQVTETFASQIPQLEQMATEQKTAIGTQQEQTRAQRESALAQARRAYEEGQIKTQQMFGGVKGSSAGQAQSEFLGRELLRQTGETQRAANVNLGTLNQALRDVQTQVANQKRQIDFQKQDALLKARDQFRNQLDTIAQQRFQLGQNRANAQLQALQDFNARRRQLEDFYTQQDAALENYRQQQQIGLQTYAQQLQIAQRYSPAATGGISNLAGLSLSALNITNPQQAKDLAQRIAASPATVQQSYNATVSPDGSKLIFTDAVTKQYGEIPLK